MNKLLLARVLMAVAVPFFAQASVAVTARQNDFEGELSRIQATRAQQETQYQKEEAICYGKFAVTDCLHAVRARRRESFELLRKQEVALRQAQRQFKAAQQLERLKEKVRKTDLLKMLQTGLKPCRHKRLVRNAWKLRARRPGHSCSRLRM